MSKIYSICLYTENFSFSNTNGTFTLRIRENDITLDKERMIENAKMDFEISDEDFEALKRL